VHGYCKKYDVRNVLDIGAGTGLLMLMLAQKCNSFIDGIEIDEPSFEQAKENINTSLWSNRLTIYLGDVMQFQFTKKYDLIISNPPFYENDLKSNTETRNTAMHDTGLKLKGLLSAVAKNLSDDGFFAVLLPYQRTDAFISDAMGEGLYLQKRMDAKQTILHSYFRSLLLFRWNEVVVQNNSMAIKDEQGAYTNDFVQLLKEYYLYL
jgi:tRNA1Val (adenine37-N6)-methyltransferase